MQPITMSNLKDASSDAWNCGTYASDLIRDMKQKGFSVSRKQEKYLYLHDPRIYMMGEKVWKQMMKRLHKKGLFSKKELVKAFKDNC